MNSIEKGNLLEDQLFDAIKELLVSENFIVPGKNSLVFKKKGYYSERRKKDIIFDISIETILPNADRFSILVLVECKNLKRKVGIEDIEEFSSKIDQIGVHNVKGVLATFGTFHSTVVDYARSTGIALIRLNSANQIEWITYRKANSMFVNKVTAHLTKEELGVLPFVCYYEGGGFRNLADFLVKLQIIDVFKRAESYIEVPYLQVETIKRLVGRFYNYKLYEDFKLNTDKVMSFLSQVYNVEFKLDIDSGSEEFYGKIEFDPLAITLSRQARLDERLWRFTLAHEIGHLILHRSILVGRIKEKRDSEYTFGLYNNLEHSNIARLEFQANLFASYLLLPDNILAPIITEYFKIYRIHRGHLYLDYQPVNQREVYKILIELSLLFNVSVSMLKIRLQREGLLVDVTDNSIRQILNGAKL